MLAAMAVAGPALCQSTKAAAVNTGDACADIVARVNQARADAPSRYIKVLMGADDRCLGVTERADKARMITRDEYVKAFKRQPDCSAPAYGYMCE